MALKLQIVIVLTFSAILSISVSSAHRVCTLDDMRLLAAEACEHIFQNTEAHSQHKRDVSNNEVPNDNNVSNHDIHFHEHSKVKIHRRDYPKGGYLLINNHHAKILHRMRHEPEYRIIPLRSYQKKLLEASNNSTEGTRGKRENSEEYINVPYCCLHKCRMDYFCRS